MLLRLETFRGAIQARVSGGDRRKRAHPLDGSARLFGSLLLGDIALVAGRACVLKEKLEAFDWGDPAERGRYWDELLLLELDSFDLCAKVLTSEVRVYEFDDMGDVDKLKRELKVRVEF